MSALVTKIRNSFSDIWLDIDLFFSKFRRKKKALPEKVPIVEPAEDKASSIQEPSPGVSAEATSPKEVSAEATSSKEASAPSDGEDPAEETVQKTGIVYAPVKTETSEKEKSFN